MLGYFFFFCPRLLVITKSYTCFMCFCPHFHQVLLQLIASFRVRHDTFFRDLRSLTIILPNHDLRSLTIILWKSHDRRSRSWSAIILPITTMGQKLYFYVPIFWKPRDWRSRSWSAIILPITINVSMKDMKT